MTAETTPTGTPGTGATPAAGATPAPPSPAEGSPATGAAPVEPPTTPDPPLGAGGEAALEAERKARRDAEKRAKDAEKALQVREEAELNEAQKAAKRLAELEAEKAAWTTERRQVFLTSAVTSLQSKLGLVDVDVVTRLLDPSAIDYDDAGKPTNTEVLVRALLHDKPFLGGAKSATTPPVGIGATEGTTGTAPAPSLTADELEAARTTGMTPERYAALKGVRTIDEWQATRRPANT